MEEEEENRRVGVTAGLIIRVVLEGCASDV